MAKLLNLPSTLVRWIRGTDDSTVPSDVEYMHFIIIRVWKCDYVRMPLRMSFWYCIFILCSGTSRRTTPSQPDNNMNMIKCDTGMPLTTFQNCRQRERELWLYTILVGAIGPTRWCSPQRPLVIAGSYINIAHLCEEASQNFIMSFVSRSRLFIIWRVSSLYLVCVCVCVYMQFTQNEHPTNTLRSPVDPKGLVSCEQIRGLCVCVSVYV